MPKLPPNPPSHYINESLASLELIQRNLEQLKRFPGADPKKIENARMAAQIASNQIEVL